MKKVKKKKSKLLAKQYLQVPFALRIKLKNHNEKETRVNTDCLQHT